MITTDTVRQLALALPEVEEHDHWGKPSFRIRKKIFATPWEKERRTVLKLPLSEQTAVAAAQPEVFSYGPWQHQGWTFVELAKVDAEMFRRLLSTAWCNVAPKRLVKAYNAQNER